jgi:trimeric autotransporter adhesin
VRSQLSKMQGPATVCVVGAQTTRPPPTCKPPSTGRRCRRAPCSFSPRRPLPHPPSPIRPTPQLPAIPSISAANVTAWKAAIVSAVQSEATSLAGKLSNVSVPDIPAQVQKAQLKKLALLASFNSTLSSAQQLKSALLASIVQEAGVAAALGKIQNKTGLPVVPTGAPGAGIPEIPIPSSIPSLPALPSVPSLPSADDLLKALPSASALNLTSKASLAAGALSSYAKSLGFNVSSLQALSDLKTSIVLSILKELPHGDIAATVFTNTTSTITGTVGAVHSAAQKAAEAKLAAATSGLASVLKQVTAAHAEPAKTVSDALAAATKTAQDAMDAKVKYASDSLDSANKAAGQLYALKLQLISDPHGLLTSALNNATAQLTAAASTAAGAVAAAKKAVAALVDAKLQAVGLAGVAQGIAANATQASARARAGWGCWLAWGWGAEQVGVQLVCAGAAARGVSSAS